MDEALIIGSNTVESSTQSRNYEVNRTKEYIEETQGEITYISASILLNTPLIPNVNDDGETIFETDEYDDVRLNEFRDLIAKAIGIEGDEDELVDKIAISQIEFYYNPYRENLEYQDSQGLDFEYWGRMAAILISLLLAGFLVNNVRKNFSGSVLQTTSNFQMENGELAGAPDLASLPTQNLDQTQAASQPALEGENEMPQQNSNAIKDEVEKLFVSQPSKATEVARLMFENG